MPIKPVTETIQLPVESASDVEALLDALVRVKDEPSESRRSDLERDLGDHFGYLAGTSPHLFESVRDRLLLLPKEDLRHFSGDLGAMVVLLEGASEQATEHVATLARDEPEEFFWHWLLVAIGSEAALTTAAELAREFDQTATYREIGVWIPPSGPAERRFSPERRAIFLRDSTADRSGPQADRHPVGLPVADVVHQQGEIAVWHYASLTTADLPGLPSWPTPKLHLVGPRLNWGYTLFSRVRADGRYEPIDVIGDETHASMLPTLRALRFLRFLPRVLADFWLFLRYSAEEEMLDEEEYLRELEAANEGQATLELVPYSADLVYCNGHIQLTEGVVGTAGGPPIALGPPPLCPKCDRLMFHVLSVEHHIRSYGDGFRLLFICETCELSACQASCWN